MAAAPGTWPSVGILVWTNRRVACCARERSPASRTLHDMARLRSRTTERRPCWRADRRSRQWPGRWELDGIDRCERTLRQSHALNPIHSIRSRLARVALYCVDQQMSGFRTSERIRFDRPNATLISELDAQPVDGGETNLFEGRSRAPYCGARGRSPAELDVGRFRESRQRYGCRTVLQPLKQRRQLAPELFVRGERWQLVGQHVSPLGLQLCSER